MMERRLLYLAALVETAAAQTAGDIKLLNGRTAGAYDGLLQVYYNSAWYSVCDDYFSDEHVALVCQQLFGTGWVSWTTDLGHCYTPVTGPTLNLEYTYSSFYYGTVDLTGTTLYDHVEGSTTSCEDYMMSGGTPGTVSVVCAFDGGASTEDQALDLSCVPGDCAPGKKQCDDGYGYTWCCGDGFPDCGDSYGWCEDRRRPSKKAVQTMWGVIFGILGAIVVFIVLTVLVCCVCCPGCPMYRYGPKVAAAPPPQGSVQMAPVPGVVVKA